MGKLNKFSYGNDINHTRSIKEGDIPNIGDDDKPIIEAGLTQTQIERAIDREGIRFSESNLETRPRNMSMV